MKTKSISPIAFEGPGMAMSEAFIIRNLDRESNTLKTLQKAYTKHIEHSYDNRKK